MKTKRLAIKMMSSFNCIGRPLWAVSKHREQHSTVGQPAELQHVACVYDGTTMILYLMGAWIPYGFGIPPSPEPSSAFEPAEL